VDSVVVDAEVVVDRVEVSVVELVDEDDNVVVVDTVVL
jgi:hypothetical protein